MDKEVRKIYKSSLTRIEKWISEHDIAIVSAMRDTLRDVTENTYIPDNMQIGDSFTVKENLRRNSQLKAYLLKHGYWVTGVSGNYIEHFGLDNAVEVAEKSFFVVNPKDDPEFYDKIFTASEYFNQDCFLYKAKNDDTAYLVGTNEFDFPGYDLKVKSGTFSTLPSVFMSRIRNAAFAFIDKDNWDVRKSMSDFTEDDLQSGKSLSWTSDRDNFSNLRTRSAVSENLSLVQDWIDMKKNGGILLETLSDFKGRQLQALINTASSISVK